MQGLKPAAMLDSQPDRGNGPSAPCAKVLAVVWSWGTSNDRYLARLISEYRAMSLGVDVVVLSNVPKDTGLGAEVMLVPHDRAWPFDSFVDALRRPWSLQ